MERPESAPRTYGSYLRLDDLLSCQSPTTDAHDELLFVVIHQVYELWFKQILHETTLLQRRLEDGNSPGALHTARHIATILKTIVGQLDILETMTPQQFASFRPELGSASGFQSGQFREIEASLGRRHFAIPAPSRHCTRRPAGAASSTHSCTTSPRRDGSCRRSSSSATRARRGSPARTRCRPCWPRCTRTSRPRRPRSAKH